MWRRVLSKDEKNIPQARRKIEGDTSGTLEERRKEYEIKRSQRPRGFR
jgi:hypothetical protein